MHVDEIRTRLQEISHLLNEQRVIRPGTLRSGIPVIGVVVTGIRRIWCDLASRWYVDPLAWASNRFNETVTRSFDQVGEVLVLLAGQLDGAQQRIAALEGRCEYLQMRQSLSQQSAAPAVPAPADPTSPQTQAAVDERDYWNGHAEAGLLRAKEEILARQTGEDEETYLRRFEAAGVEHAGELATYYDATSKVLEIGCGVGRILKHIRCRERWGLDISQGMLDWASIYLADQEGVHLVKTNGFDCTGVPSDYFDLVYSVLVLQHINKRSGFNYLREAYRVLRPGGRFYFHLLNLLSEEGFQLFLRTIADDYRYFPLYFHTPEEICYELAQTGLQVDEVGASEQTVHMRVVGTKPRTQP